MTSEIRKFDNRHLQQDYWIRIPNKQCSLHFIFKFAGKRIVYCYIRKNACSAFKRLIVGLSDAGPKPKPRENPLFYMLRHHRVENFKDIVKADHVIFVHRDPIDRIISLFKNKFIQQKENIDIFKNYWNVTGNDPTNATFRDFVENYLNNHMDELDPHLLPQRTHLLPIVYTDSIPILKLHEAMATILNIQTADTYFSSEMNSTITRQNYENLMVADTPAVELHKIWLKERALPTRQSFLFDKNIENKLRLIYAQDEVFMVNNCQRDSVKQVGSEKLPIYNLDNLSKETFIPKAEQDQIKEQFNFRKINLIIFPDWNTSEETLLQQLGNTLKTISNHPKAGEITLLLDLQGMSQEDADLALSSAVMNLMMEEGIELREDLEVSPVGDIDNRAWKTLLSLVNGRISIETEERDRVQEIGAEKLPVYTLDSLSKDELSDIMK